MLSSQVSGASTFRSSDYDQVFFVGDVHGDPLVLLETALLSEAFGTDSPPVLQELIAIHRTFTASYVDTHAGLLGMSLGLHHLHWHKGARTLVVFVGDILDNYRYGNVRRRDGKVHEPYRHADSTVPLSRTTGAVRVANMAMNGERPIVETLSRLQREARENGGDIVWVLGNHDVGNVLPSIACHSYAALDQCDPVDSSLFSMDRSGWVRAYLLQMGAVALCMVDDVLVCHGGLSEHFLRELGTAADTPPIHIDTINGLYRAALQTADSREGEQVSRILHSTQGPTWCRPLGVGVTTRPWNPTHLGWVYTQDTAGRATVPKTMIVAHTNVATPLSYLPAGGTQLLPGPDVVARWGSGSNQTPDTIYRSPCWTQLSTGAVMGVDFALSRGFNTLESYATETFCSMAIMEYQRSKDQALVSVIGRLHPRCIPPHVLQRAYDHRDNPVSSPPEDTQSATDLLNELTRPALRSVARLTQLYRLGSIDLRASASQLRVFLHEAYRTCGPDHREKIRQAILSVHSDKAEQDSARRIRLVVP
jgi:hypothetical protein